MSTRHSMNKGWIGMMAALAVAGMVPSTRGGSLDDPGAPTDSASAMYTAKDLYNRLAFGTNAPKRTGAFTEPTAGPTAGTMPTTDEIMAKAPATNASGAVAGEVLSGKTFWGLTQDAWGTRTGTIATVTLSATTANVAAGYYAATNLAQVDTDLVAGNIATNVTIFGIAGTANTNAGGGTYSAAVPKTGQTPTLPLNPAPAGSDGNLQKGVAWPNPRFSPVAGSGAETNQIRDNLTGLIWARNADFGGAKSWQAALDYIAATNASGTLYGGTNDWRLPNERELKSLTHSGYYSPALCNTAGTGQWTENDPFTGVQSDTYWSGTTYAASSVVAWYVNLNVGHVATASKTDPYYVWPVRGGQ